MAREHATRRAALPALVRALVTAGTRIGGVSKPARCVQVAARAPTYEPVRVLERQGAHEAVSRLNPDSALAGRVEVDPNRATLLLFLFIGRTTTVLASLDSIFAHIVRYVRATANRAAAGVKCRPVVN